MDWIVALAAYAAIWAFVLSLPWFYRRRDRRWREKG